MLDYDLEALTLGELKKCQINDVAKAISTFEDRQKAEAAQGGSSRPGPRLLPVRTCRYRDEILASACRGEILTP